MGLNVGNISRLTEDFCWWWISSCFLKYSAFRSLLLPVILNMVPATRQPTLTPIPIKEKKGKGFASGTGSFAVESLRCRSFCSSRYSLSVWTMYINVAALAATPIPPAIRNLVEIDFL